MEAGSGGSGGSGSNSPCGACKFLRRKCAADCIFAPYFCSEQGPARFAAIHKIFGASNVSKLLLHVPLADRCEAVVTIAYEAQARIRDPIYGCVAHIFALQQQVAALQAQLMQVKAQLAQSAAGNSRMPENPNLWPGTAAGFPHPGACSYMQTMSPQSSLDSVDYNACGMGAHQMPFSQETLLQQCNKRRYPSHDLGELQALALRMMRN